MNEIPFLMVFMNLVFENTLTCMNAYYVALFRYLCNHIMHLCKTFSHHGRNNALYPYGKCLVFAAFVFLLHVLNLLTPAGVFQQGALMLTTMTLSSLL